MFVGPFIVLFGIEQDNLSQVFYTKFLHWVILYKQRHVFGYWFVLVVVNSDSVVPPFKLY